MPMYRAYIVGPKGSFIGAHDIRCDDDDEAIKLAQRYVEGHDVELWLEGRLVSKLRYYPKS